MPHVLKHPAALSSAYTQLVQQENLCPEDILEEHMMMKSVDTIQVIMQNVMKKKVIVHNNNNITDKGIRGL